MIQNQYDNCDNFVKNNFAIGSSSERQKRQIPLRPKGICQIRLLKHLGKNHTSLLMAW